MRCKVLSGPWRTPIIQSHTPTDVVSYRNGIQPLFLLPPPFPLHAVRLCPRSRFTTCSVIRRVESENIPKFSAEDYERLRAGGAGARLKDMREDFSEPELSHPGEDIEGRVRSGMSSGMAKAATLRDVGKKVRPAGGKMKNEWGQGGSRDSALLYGTRQVDGGGMGRVSECDRVFSL